MSFFLDLIIYSLPAYIDRQQANLNKILFPNEFYYNLWNDFLDKRKYKGALESYMRVSCDNKADLCAKKHHNIWNLFFEIAVNNKIKINTAYLKSSLEYYKKSLSFKEDSETLHNKEVVEKLLEEIESKSNSWDSSNPEKPNNNKKKNWEKTDFKELEWRLEFLIKEEIRFQNKVNKQRQDSAETPFWQWFYELFSMPFPKWATKSDFTENKRDF